MAIDPNLSTPPTKSYSAIENEIPTYRAISGLAIVSLLLGLLSVFSFANLMFLAAAVGAVVFGALALRSIRRYPDMLTGTGFANAGIGIGLICGLSALTIGLVSSTVIKNRAQSFAEHYCDTLMSGSLAETFYLHVPADIRVGKTPEQTLQEMQESGREQFEMDDRTAAIRALRDRLAESNLHIHARKVEKSGTSGLEPYAFVLLAFEGDVESLKPDERFAMLELKAHGNGARWYVEGIRYPYDAGSVELEVQSSHGHSH